MSEYTEKDIEMLQKPANLQQFVDFYNDLSANNLGSLAAIYHPDVQFIDPVHEIHGIAALEHYFAHAYARLSSCHFEPVQQAVQDSQGFLSWVMTLSHPAIAAGKNIEVQGCTVLRWHKDGRIIYHRDYYDLTDMVYRHIPVLGWLTAKVKQKMAQD